jgi:Skp family chaperone for outer membrane proteins
MLRSLAIAVLAAVFLMQSLPSATAQNQDYFIPGQSKPAPAARPSAPRPPPRTAPSAPSVTPDQGLGVVPGQGESGQPLPPPTVQLPPVPDLPPLPKGAAPPAAVIGVLGVPEVMHASSAAQQVEKVIGERRRKLDEDAQKEQATWRDMQQALATDRAKLSPEQIRTRERELQERITNAQRSFRDRNRIIQEAAQYGLAQIERTLVLVIRQVADSRGMNLVLHRSQVALNVNEFDITQQVAEQLNKVLANVAVPPEGVSPSALPKPAAAPPVAAAPAPAPDPAVAPPAPAPAAAPAPQ